VRSPVAHSPAELAVRLRGRRPEIEAAALTRVNAIADSSSAADPAYVQGLRGAVAAALDYGIAAVERGEDRGPPIPVALRAQARIAARNGVSLDTVLRRYFGGYSLLGYFIIEEASRDGLMDGAELQRLLAAQAVIFDRLLRTVSEEHTRESEALVVSSEQRQAKRIERLLEGELIDTTGIAYDFGGWHLGAVAAGPDAVEGLRELSQALDCRLLLVRPDDGTAWVWLGSRRKHESAEPIRLAASPDAGHRVLAVGEPAQGLAGWRLTHRQAAAAMPIALRTPGSAVRYTDVALLASVLRDDLFATSLRMLYLAPLKAGGDGGETLRRTLRAYFEAGRNVSSAAAALGVKRHTVTKRLRAIEGKIGRPIDSCGAELDVALRLEEVDE
jgi:PucR-like helix-turn-helix protein/diguanylate cyclase with GGDEF domain